MIMSSLAVRQAFEAAWTVKVPALSLEETANDEPDRKNLPTNWATVDYSGTEDPDLGHEFRRIRRRGLGWAAAYRLRF